MQGVQWGGINSSPMECLGLFEMLINATPQQSSETSDWPSLCHRLSRRHLDTQDFGHDQTPPTHQIPSTCAFEAVQVLCISKDHLVTVLRGRLFSLIIPCPFQTSSHILSAWVFLKSKASSFDSNILVSGLRGPQGLRNDKLGTPNPVTNRSPETKLDSCVRLLL